MPVIKNHIYTLLCMQYKIYTAYKDFGKFITDSYCLFLCTDRTDVATRLSN